MSATGAAAPRTQRYGFLLILLFAAAAMTPELVLGLTMSDSFRYNLLWPEQFGALFRQGHLYPRWLPNAWSGLGNPTFYFYPPLFFWVTAAVDALTLGTLPSERFTPLATLVVLAASGLTMRAWLKDQIGPKPALVAAIAYMIAPYHLYDIYVRGALAEATAYASLPVAALALKRLGQGNWRDVPLLAVAYACLLLTHLPSALLVSLFLIVPYVVFIAVRCDRSARFLILALAGGVLGIGLAAIYLVPALTLLPYVSADALSASFYRPENWFFWHVNAGQFGGRMLFIAPISVAASLFAAGVAFFMQRRADRREPLFWAILTIALVLLIAGVIPPIWRLPGLALVQFPWRALLLVEFAAITAVAIARPPLRKPIVFAGAFVLGIVYMLFALLMAHLLPGTARQQAEASANIRSDYPDAPEYLAAGTKIVQGDGPAPEHIEIPRLRAASAADPRAKIAAVAAADGSMAVRVESPEPTRIVLPRFYFPSWRVWDGVGGAVPVEPSGERLVSFAAPAGRSTFQLSLGEAPYQRAGEIVSLAALLALGAIFVGARRKRSAGEGAIA